MLRLSVFYRKPLHEVMQWPAKHIALLTTFLGIEPVPEVRIEQSIAQLSALFVNKINQLGGSNADPVGMSKFLLYHDAMKPPIVDVESDRYSDADRLMLSSLMSLGKTKQ